MGGTAGYSATKTAAGNIRRSGSSAWSSCPFSVTALWRSAPSFAFPEGRTMDRLGPRCGGPGQGFELHDPVAVAAPDPEPRRRRRLVDEHPAHVGVGPHQALNRGSGP